VQLRPELADGFEKRQIPGVKLSCVFHVDACVALIRDLKTQKLSPSLEPTR
jgi:hypothetical protein